MEPRLAGTTFGYLHHRSLEGAIDHLADHGLTEIELTPMPPHFHVPSADPYRRRALARHLERRGVACVSVNPGFVDINLVSVNPEFRELSLRFVEHGIELAHDLSAPWHVVVGGRLHGLAPVATGDALAVLEDALSRLLDRAEPLGVGIALENSPYGFLGRAEDVLAVVEAVDRPRLGVCYDVANALGQEDPVDGMSTVGHRLGLVHLSDAWHDRWAHTSPGRGDVDFAAFADAVVASGYVGPCVYELVDGEDPAPRLADDLRLLAAAGWSSTGARTVA